MNAPLLSACILLASVLLSYGAGGILRRVAMRRAILSSATRQRGGPGGVPLLGGVAALLAVVGGYGLGMLPAGDASRTADPWTAASLGALLLAFGALGLRDDVGSLSPATRLLAEISLALTLLSLAYLGPPSAWREAALTPEAGMWIGLTAVGVVAGANALNMVDNADALAASTAGSSLLALVFWMSTAPVEPAAGGLPGQPLPWAPEHAGLAAAGALGGFLLWNRPPARLYLGDSGSLPLGALGALLVCHLLRGGAGGPAWAAMPLVLGYLIVDPLYAVAGRLRAGRAPWRGGVDHLSHHLTRLTGRWPRALLLILSVHVFSLVTGIGFRGGVLPWPALPVALAPWVALWIAGRRGARLPGPEIR